MKITPTDKPNTTQVSDMDGKDDDSINEDEIEWNIQHIEKMDQEPTQWIPKHNIQQVYHTIIKEWGQQNPEKLQEKSYRSISNNLKTIMKTKMHKDIQPTQDHWKTYKQIQTHEKTMRVITKNSTGYQITKSLYKKFQPHLKKFNQEPISKPDAVTIANTTTTTTITTTM